jgi:hypothetical protein
MPTETEDRVPHRTCNETVDASTWRMTWGR